MHRCLLLGFFLVSLVGGAPAVAPTVSGTVVPLPEKTSIPEALRKVATIFPGTIDDRNSVGRANGDIPGGNLAYWAVLENIASRTQSLLRVLPEEGTILLLPGGPSKTPTAVSGPFRLVVRRITSSIDLETATTSHSASIEVNWEPNIYPFFVESRPRGLQVQFTDGQTRQGPDEGTAPVPVDGRFATTFTIRLPVIPRAESAIAGLSGKLEAIVPTRMVSVTMPSLAELEAAPSSGAPVLSFPKEGPAGRITKIVRNRERWSVQVVLPTPPGGEMFESYQSWVIQNNASLRRADGTVWRSSGYILEGNTPSRSVVTYHFLVRDCPGESDPAVWKFHYTTPAGIIRQEIPFRFTDLLLP